MIHLKQLFMKIIYSVIYHFSQINYISRLYSLYNKMVFMFDTKDKDKSDKNSELTYNYYDVDINDSDITIEDSAYMPAKDNFSTKNIVVNYYNQENKPNLTYPDYSMKYTGRTIRLYGLLHNNIKDITCDTNGQPLDNGIVGELVVEQTTFTVDKIFTCFLIKNTNTIKDVKPNTLDNLIKQYELPEEEQKKKIKFNLNDYIKNSNCITYKSGSNTVIIFTSPISANVSGDVIKKYSKTSSLFNNYPLDQNKYFNINEFTNVGGTDKTKSGQKKDDDIYIDCTPTGEQADKIVTYNVPINSEYTADAGKLNFMKTTIHLCMVLMFIILVYFLVPIVYKGIIIDNINKFIEPKEGKFTQDEFKIAPNYGNKKIVNTFVRIRSVDITLTTIFLLIFVALIYEGYSVKDNFDMILYALYFAIFFGLAFATVQFNKNSLEFMRTKVKTETGKADLRGGLFPDELEDKSPVNFFQITDFIAFLGASLLYIFTGKKGYVILTLIFLASLTFGILLLLWYLGNVESFQKVLYILLVVIITILLPVVPTAILSSEDIPDYR